MRVVVFEHNFIGDVFLTTPFLRAAHRAGMEVHALTRERALAALAGNPCVAGSVSRDGKGVLRRLRRARFSAAFLVRGTIGDALLAAAAGIPRRYGFRREGARALLSGSVPFGRGHIVAETCSLLRAAGIEPGDPGPLEFVPTDEARAEAARLVPAGPFVVLHPGSTRPAKRWEDDRWSVVADGIAGIGLEAVVVGLDPAEGEAIARRCARPPRNLCGRTSLPVLGALLSRAQAFVGTDSGPMHLACAAGTRVLALFGSTDPSRSGPWGEGHRVLRGDCPPCRRDRCPEGRSCMASITAEAVLDELRELLP